MLTSRKHCSYFRRVATINLGDHSALGYRCKRVVFQSQSHPFPLPFSYSLPHIRLKALSSGALGRATEHHNWLALLPITDLEQLDTFLDRTFAVRPVRAGRSAATRFATYRCAAFWILIFIRKILASPQRATHQVTITDPAPRFAVPGATAVEPFNRLPRASACVSPLVVCLPSSYSIELRR